MMMTRRLQWKSKCFLIVPFSHNVSTSHLLSYLNCKVHDGKYIQDMAVRRRDQLLHMISRLGFLVGNDSPRRTRPSTPIIKNREPGN